eukprot:Sdes_comp9484_c0_seq1m955
MREILKFSSHNLGVKIDSIIQGIHMTRCHLCSRKSSFHIFRCVQKFCTSSRILRNILTIFFFKIFHKMKKNSLIKQIPANFIRVNRFHNRIEPVGHMHDGNVKTRTGQVENQHHSIEMFLLGFLANTISENCGSRFIDKPENLQIDIPTSFQYTITLKLIEMIRHRKDSSMNSITTVGFCRGF